MGLAAWDAGLLAGVIAGVFAIGSLIMIISSGRARFNLTHLSGWFRSTYVLRRWLSNPFKVCEVGLLWQANLQQLALSGPLVPMAGEVDYHARLWLTCANLLGGAIAFYALHVRDFEASIRLEGGAYAALVGPLGIWVGLVYATVPLPNTSYGLNLTEAFLIACTIRVVMILRYRHATRRALRDPSDDNLARRKALRELLGN